MDFGNECIIQENKDEYYRITVDGSLRFVHRIMYQIFKGRIPTGFVVHHRCFNKGCINPNHLETTTVEDNTRLNSKYIDLENKIIETLKINPDGLSVQKIAKSIFTEDFDQNKYTKISKTLIKMHSESLVTYINHNHGAFGMKQYKLNLTAQKMEE